MAATSKLTRAQAARATTNSAYKLFSNYLAHLQYYTQILNSYVIYHHCLKVDIIKVLLRCQGVNYNVVDLLTIYSYAARPDNTVS